MRAWSLDVARVLFAWLVLLAIEQIVISLAFRDLLAGAWEAGLIRNVVTPLALVASAPLAPLAVALLRRMRASAAVAASAGKSRGPRMQLSLTAAALGGALGYGVTFGRHFESWGVRAPFVIGACVVAAAATWVVAPPIARAPGWARALLGVLVAAVFWCADERVLLRLYPALHAAFIVVALFGAAMTALSFDIDARTRAARAFGAAVLLILAAAVAWTPFAARTLAPATNLRLVLVEHAPLLGRAVLFATRLAPLERRDHDDDGAPPAGPDIGEIPRALDWSGRDIVVVSIDALRADHVSAYGYARATTPNVDALAREGMLFERAYCPTPHTSYSVTSMMTGKYMRPLLELGLGEDSETWAHELRRYDYRTGAFYPPAVFFIDESRFRSFESSTLDFEYARVEFLAAKDRAPQVAAYLEGETSSRPVFLWVHLFEPHEPYVMHPEHPFGGRAPTDLDAYDSEIAAADEGVGDIVRVVRAKRPGAVIMVTADHGEEFGEHGGRYHGTTVYEEQVHVPLVVVGPGVAAAARAPGVVQTIDLLPTTLSAIGVPRPARLRGRDLGPALAGKAGGAGEKGFAFAETDDYALVAEKSERLVCARKLAACALYDLASDAEETHDVAAAHPADAEAMRKTLRAVERDHGRFEASGDAAWPEALRRGMQGEVEAAPEVASLLDDANVGVRRKSAEVLFELRADVSAPELTRALARDEDEEVRRWCALSLARLDPPLAANARDLVLALSSGGAIEWRRRAALVLAERGDARGADDLAAWWAAAYAGGEGALDLAQAKQLLAAMAKVRDRAAVAPLVRSLDDVRLRPLIADTLAAIGDASAARALLAAFADERYVTTRPHEAHALVALGVRAELRPALARFAGTPEPMREALSIARDAGLLDAPNGGWDRRAQPLPPPGAGPQDLTLTLTVAPATRADARLLVLAKAGAAALTGTFEDGASHALAPDTSPSDGLHVIELGALASPKLTLRLREPSGIEAVWIVARADELPPPPPAPWREESRDKHDERHPAQPPPR